MIYSEKNFEIGELSDGGCDIKFLHFHFQYKIVSWWQPGWFWNYVTTYLVLRPDVTFAASGRSKYDVGTYFLLHKDVSFTASERNFLPFFASKIAKNDRKSLVLNRKSNVFAKYLLSFRPKISQKHLYFADFMPKVVIGGNKVTIKTPLITTRYSLIIKELRREWQMWY